MDRLPSDPALQGLPSDSPDTLLHPSAADALLLAYRGIDNSERAKVLSLNRRGSALALLRHLVAGRAAAGQVLVTESVIRSTTDQGASFEDFGAAELKGIAQPLPLYRDHRA
jgi:class 3 adenylate cyclase